MINESPLLLNYNCSMKEVFTKKAETIAQNFLKFLMTRV